MTPRNTAFLALLAVGACGETPAPVAPTDPGPASAAVTRVGQNGRALGGQGANGYDITLFAELEGDSLVDFTTEQWRAIWRASEKWESVLAPSDPWDIDAGFMYCLGGDGRIVDGSLVRPGEIDDIVVLVRAGYIDGPGGTLGQAQTCAVRARGFLPPFGPATLDFMPAYSFVLLDEADLDRIATEGRLYDLMLHELGHAVGLVPWAWTLLDLVGDVRPAGSAIYHDTHFTGSGSIEAFDAAGGSTYAGKKVPVDNTGFRFTGHWRGSVLGLELMTPTISQNDSPLSRITARALEPLGYTVDLTKADAYTIPEGGISADQGSRLPIGDDVRSGPLLVIDRSGRLLRPR